MENDILPVPFRLENYDHQYLTELIKSKEISFVAIAGGDGTISAVVNTMMKADVLLPLALIPAGTCNDLARSLDIPVDIKKSMDIILAGNTAYIDAGLINNEIWFLNTCAGGNFVDVSYSTNSDLKRNFGTFAYYLNALQEVAQLKPFYLKVTTDENVIEGDFLMFLILNGRHAAGFNDIAKHADISDGFMNIMLVKNCQRYELPGMFLRAISRDFSNDKNVISMKAKSCTIESDSNMPLTVDGEMLSTLPINITFLNKVLKVFL